MECLEALERAIRAIRSSGLVSLSETDYRTLLEWGRLKRMLAEAAAACIRSRYGGAVREVYYLDLVGGEVAETPGRDIDIVVVVDDELEARRREIEESIEKSLNMLLDTVAGWLRGITGGKPVFEVHVVTPRSHDYLSLIGSRHAPPVKL
jgi:predicted nucleotidyltransferase